MKKISAYELTNGDIITDFAEANEIQKQLNMRDELSELEFISSRVQKEELFQIIRKNAPLIFKILLKYLKDETQKQKN